MKNYYLHSGNVGIWTRDPSDERRWIYQCATSPTLILWLGYFRASNLELKNQGISLKESPAWSTSLPADSPSFITLIYAAGNDLLATVISNSFHVLHPVCPPFLSKRSCLRKRAFSGLRWSDKTNFRIFICNSEKKLSNGRYSKNRFHSLLIFHFNYWCFSNKSCWWLCFDKVVFLTVLSLSQLFWIWSSCLV